MQGSAMGSGLVERVDADLKSIESNDQATSTRVPIRGQFEVLKFGGSSQGTAERLSQVTYIHIIYIYHNIYVSYIE